MSEAMPKMAPLYGAAFGFNTDRRVKPVHFATGFFVALFGRQNRTELLNYLVAVTDGRTPAESYLLPKLHESLTAEAKISSAVDQQSLHVLRKHLRCIASNDEAVYPIYGGAKEFGCDYTTASHDILTSTRDNDGFAGFFVHSVLAGSEDGQKVLELARAWMMNNEAPLREIFRPLLSEDFKDADPASKYTSRFGELSAKRVKKVSQRMRAQTLAIRTLCENADQLVASETKIRFLIIGLCVWLFRYLVGEALDAKAQQAIFLADVTGDSASRMRAQSRWSYARTRETIGSAFSRFAEEGRFDECDKAWAYAKKHLNGRPKFEEFYRELAVRSGLAQPRASRVPAKHFEPQPDTLRVLLLSVLPVADGMVNLEDALNRLHATWNIVFGGRDGDVELLADLGYTGLDQDRDIGPNTAALIEFLSDLGLATKFSDGLVMCHSVPSFSQ